MEIPSKVALLLLLVTTTVSPVTRYSDIWGIQQEANAEDTACREEGHSQRYCEWRFNKRHWPYEDRSPYPSFEEYMDRR